MSQQIRLDNQFQLGMFAKRIARIRESVIPLNSVEEDFVTGLENNWQLLGQDMRISVKQMNWLGSLANERTPNL